MSNTSDLTIFEQSVEQLLERIPKDGSTVDLEPLVSMLVDLSSSVSINSLLTVAF